MEIWTEKYRPETLGEVIGHKQIVDRLKAFIKKDSVPHCLFAGPAGTGKTTCALAMAHDLYGDNWKQNFMETNASDERGIDVVRNKIKDFARTRAFQASFKIIFLDESDSLTSEAQQALRRTMEKFSDACRFILSANFSSKIIEPIQSRTAVFRFNRLDEDPIEKYLNQIAKSEELEISDEGTEALIDVSEGDLRKLTNVLQAASVLGTKIDQEAVFNVAASLRPEEVKKILVKSLQGEFKSARNELRDLMVKRGMDGVDIIKSIYKEIYDLDISEEKKVKLMELLGKYEYRLVEGSAPDIQIEALLAELANLDQS